MDPPTLREIELETLLRTRDAQVNELTVEVIHLRQYLSNQPGPSPDKPVSLPPALLSLLQPHINGVPHIDTQGSTSGSTTVTAALTQRARSLQEENDELYSLLRMSETGKLKEEVRYLRRVVSRLERALTESHGVVTSLSCELDKSYDAFLSRENASRESYTDSRSPPRHSNHSPQMNSSSNVQNSKPIPTGPRAHKKPRLSESHTSPARSTISLPNSHSNPQMNAPHKVRRDRSPHMSVDSHKAPTKMARMDIDDESRSRLRSPRERSRDIDDDRSYGRDRERGRDREKERDRTRERERVGERRRDRERDRSRRNGASSGGGGGGGGRRGQRGHASHGNGDRTLAERMGLKKHA